MKRFSLLLFFAANLPFMGAAMAAPAAILTRVSGGVQVFRGAQKIVARDGLALQNGDKIVVSPRGGATIFSLNAAPQRLTSGSAIVGAVKAKNGAAPLWKGVYDGLSRGLGAPNRQIAATMRPGEIQLLSPVASLIETPRPRFSWRAGALDAPQYQITVFGAQSQIVWRAQSAQMSLQYGGAAPLQGALSWNVAPLRLENGVWTPIADWTSRTASFQIASPTQIAQLRAQLRQFDAQSATLNLPDRILARAALLSARGFKESALRELGAANDAASAALRQSLWRETGQDWRLAALPKPENIPMGRADRAILSYSPDAPLQIQQRKIYRAPEGSFALQIPFRFCLTTASLPQKVAVFDFGAAPTGGARLGIVLAPAREFSSPDALRNWARSSGQKMRFEAPRDTVFRSQKARISAWNETENGVLSRGQWLEWSEDAHRIAAVWSAPDLATLSALRPLFDTLETHLGPHETAPDGSSEALTRTMEAALAQMADLNARQRARNFEPPQNLAPPTRAELEILEKARLQTPADSHERALAALVASRVAARLAWNTSDAALSARAFERRAALDEENYRAELAALDADTKQNDALIAQWSRVTPPQNLSTAYGIALDGLLILKRMIATQKQLLALKRGDARALQASGRALFDLQRRELEAIRLGTAKTAIPTHKQLEEKKLLLAGALEDLGDAAQEGADLDGARAYFSRALEWRRAVPLDAGPRGVSQSLRQRGSLEAELGDNRLARSFFEAALVESNREAPALEKERQAQGSAEVREVKRAEALQNRAVTWNNLGIVSQNLGDFTGAETALKQALDAVAPLSTEGYSGSIRASMRAVTLGNLAVLRANSGDLEGADTHFQEAIALSRALGDDKGLALALLNSAGLADSRGDTEGATTKIAAARTLFVQLQQVKPLLAADVFASKLARRRGDFALAASRAQAALTLARSVGDAEWIAAAARALGTARLEAAGKNPLSPDDQTLIAAVLGEAEAADARSGDALSRVATLNLRARSQEKSGDLNGALQTFQAAIARLETVRATTSSAEKFSDLDENSAIYDGAVRLLLKLNRPDEAFDLLGRARSQKLRDVLQLSALKSNDPALQKLLERAAALDEKLGKTRARLAAEVALPTPQRDPAAIETLQGLVASTQAQFFAVSAQIRAKNPRFDTALALSPRELKKAQRAIPAGVLLLQYAALDDGLYIFAVTRDGLKIYAPKASKIELQSAVRAYRGAIDADLARVAKGETPSSIDAASPLRSASESLSKWLIAPVQSDINAARVVAIVPSGELFYLPFHALGRAQNDGKWKFLVEEKPLAYLAAGDILSIAAPRDEEPAGRGLLALGDPTGADLPAARLEVEAIARLFPDSRALIGANASKAAMLLPSSRDKRILHLAAHGVLDGARPEQSFIQLAPSKNDDGKLRVGEIYGLDLGRVDLVTLSACQTALGEGSPDGSEISSLAQSFSSAGTPSVVASLWNVEDRSTARLMESFYGALADGQPKGEALQSAQIALLRDAKTRHPLFWAPFELLGDWR